MKKDRNEKFKKAAVVAGLLAAGVITAAGICLKLNREEPPYVAESLVQPEETTEPVRPEITYETPLPTAAPEIVVYTKTVPEASADGPEQSIQPDPVKTEDTKPAAPPEEATDTGNEDRDNPPENTEIPAVPSPEPGNESDGRTPSGNTGTPQNGAVSDGKVYIDGFGWIDYNGGETEVIQGGGIYENGNTIGIMD